MLDNGHLRRRLQHFFHVLELHRTYTVLVAERMSNVALTLRIRLLFSNLLRV